MKLPAGTPSFPGMPNEDSCDWKRPIPQNMPQEIDIERAADLIARYCESIAPESEYIPGM